MINSFFQLQSFFLICNLSLLQKDFGLFLVVLLLFCKRRAVEMTSAITTTFACMGEISSVYFLLLSQLCFICLNLGMIEKSEGCEPAETSVGLRRQNESLGHLKLGVSMS